MSHRIGRLLTAMVTPFDRNGDVDITRTKELAQALVASGSEGLVVTGTTGEAPTLSFKEKIQLYEAVRDAVSPSVSVIAGTSLYNTAESIELTDAAERTGAVDAFLFSVPPYSKPTQEGLYRHFSVLAERTEKPCILYNVPGRTVTNLNADTVARLRAASNVVGIKEASANLEQIGTIVESCGPEFLVWSGNDGDTLPILAIGGYGVVSVTSHLVGHQIQRMITAFFQGDVETAAKIHRRHLPLIASLFQVGSPVPLKYALEVIGFSVGEPRLPLCAPDEKVAANVRDVLSRQHIDIPVPAVG
jgi:4-hydroxy-tetrahydrodipicolinate synthase